MRALLDELDALLAAAAALADEIDAEIQAEEARQGDAAAGDGEQRPGPVVIAPVVPN